MKIALVHTTSNGDYEEICSYFRSCCFIELTDENISQHIDEGFSKILKSFEEFTQRGPGWTLKKIHYLELKTAKYLPLAASSYIPLPPKLVAKKTVLNVQNEDQKCLVWGLLAHRLDIHREKHPKKISHYIAYVKEINLGDIECSVSLHKIPLIEKLNQLRINIFGYENVEQETENFLKFTGVHLQHPVA